MQFQLPDESITLVEQAQPNQPLFVIGDVHGEARSLIGALRHADTLRQSLPDLVVVLLGDLVDRGPKSFECLQIAAAYRAERPNVVLLMGNHEQFLLCALFSPDEDEAGRALYNALHNKGGWILERGIDEVKAFLITAKLTPDDFQLSYQNGNCLCVHAGIPPHATPEELKQFFQSDKLKLPKGSGDSHSHPLWIRNAFLAETIPHPDLFVIHGHTRHDFTGKPLKGRLNLDASGYRREGVSCVAGALITPDSKVNLKYGDPLLHLPFYGRICRSGRHRLYAHHH